jgi:2-oxoglutarate dehydrogenase E2 component (dihydrolipoamide succinyltransferase)
MSPAARKLAREEGIESAAIRGSGRQGRITKSDVTDVVARRSRESAGATAGMEPTAAPAQGSALPTPPSETVAASRAMPPHHAGDRNLREERKPMSRLRARIAERLVEAQQTAAILTTFNEIDLKPVFDLRRRHKDAFEKQYGVRLGFMSFFVKAAVESLRRFPAVNASIEGNDVVYHHYYDIGIAVSSPRGLVVPILRNVDRMSFAEIEEGIRDFGVKAQANQLSLDDLQGGTFTISNGGVFGSMLSTPILNPPQSGILGLHAIKDRPVAVSGSVEIRPVMYVALSYDHRIIDGREAVSFLVVIKEVLEDPARLLIQI